mgnify:CR=1 FL=1
MTDERLRAKIEDYVRAVARLGEGLEEDLSNPLVYDGVIQRFEFTYELAWKCLKAYLEREGLQPGSSPRAVFKEAFAAGFLPDGDVWIDMIDDRNLTVHTYNESLARQIYQHVKERYYPALADLARTLAEAVS